MLAYLDTRSEVLNWYTPFSGTVIIVSNYLPNYLTNLISTKFPLHQFLITEANASAMDGRLPNTAWKFLQTPHSSGRWDTPLNSLARAGGNSALAAYGNMLNP